jgi:hypothetical protein
LLAVVPPVALSLHLLYGSRLRARAERAAWQRLAATAEELNDTDLTTVLERAVTNAVQLFSAEEAEVFLRDGPDGPILVRGDINGVQWSGDPGRPRRAAPTCRASPRAWPGTTSRPMSARSGCTTPWAWS